jgi:hypothetical protein
VKSKLEYSLRESFFCPGGHRRASGAVENAAVRIINSRLFNRMNECQHLEGFVFFGINGLIGGGTRPHGRNSKKTDARQSVAMILLKVFLIGYI